MSISYIVPVWREETYKNVARPWLIDQVESFGAELIEVRNSRSIFHALERGRLRAKGRYLFYVHDDVRLIAPQDLTPRIAAAFEQHSETGLIGPVGKAEGVSVPWWKNNGPYVGHYCRRDSNGDIIYQSARENRSTLAKRKLDFSDIDGLIDKPFAQASFVDGFFLAEDRKRLSLPWDLETFGENWHGYDIDRCMQVIYAGLEVRTAPWLFLHDNAGHKGYKGTEEVARIGMDERKRIVKSEGDRLWLSDLSVANRDLKRKWGLKICAC